MIRVTKAQKLSVRCFRCGASPGKFCVSLHEVWGRYYTLGSLHRERRQAWIDWSVEDASKSA